MAATVAEAVGIVDAEDAEDAVDAVDTAESVEPETATKVSAPIAKLTAIQQIHTGNGNTLRRKETTISVFPSCGGSYNTSKSIASPTNV
jgi:hypothetical protein